MIPSPAILCLTACAMLSAGWAHAAEPAGRAPREQGPSLGVHESVVTPMAPAVDPSAPLDELPPEPGTIASTAPASSTASGFATANAGTYVLSERTERARQLLAAGIRFETGEGVEQSFSRAAGLYCASARADFPDAYIRLGWIYANGRGVHRDDSIATTLFQRAAALGSDIGERVSEMFRGPGGKLPQCLGGPPEPQGPIAIDVIPGANNYAAMPSVADPAQFKNFATSPERRKIVDLVMQHARQFKLDPRLVLALINTESAFDPLARSPKNASGLMQLIPDTAERFAVRNIYDPVDNIRGGMSYLRWLLAYFKGDVVLAVAGYNAGEGAVDRYRGVPPYAETMAYVQRIRTLYPLDHHPFDPTATPPSSIFTLKSRDAGGTPAPARPRS